MPDQRDPRVDPRPGDVITRGFTDMLFRRVAGGFDKNVAYSTRNGHRSWCSIGEWRAWASDARVVARGEEQGS